jgi:hypothetical protein
MSQNPRYRSWCFTLNNYTDEHLEKLGALECKYIVYGKEVGANGTPHLQGYVTFKDPIPKKRAIKRLRGAHVSVAKGNALQNYEYCTKDGAFTERGTRPLTANEKGAKGTEYWEGIKAAAVSGDLDQVDAKTYVNMYRTLVSIKKDHMSKPAPLASTTGEWWYGPSGTGKSRLARETYPDAYIKGSNKWWDGYRGEATVIIEDLDKFNVAMGGDLKRWCDHYSFPAEVKGGGMNIRPKKIIMTSQYKIDEIWDDQATQDALDRRCKKRKFSVGANVYE